MSYTTGTYTIGIDIGGTKVLGGVVDEMGNLLESARRDTPREGGTHLISTIAEVAQELLTDYQVESIGLSAAGFVSSDRKTMLATPNIAAWNGVNLESELRKFIDLPIVLENDANAAAWGELRFGAGQGVSNLLMVTVGTGIGGGIIVNGGLLRGATVLQLRLVICGFFQKVISAVVVREVVSNNTLQETLCFATHVKQLQLAQILLATYSLAEMELSKV